VAFAARDQRAKRAPPCLVERTLGVDEQVGGGAAQHVRQEQPGGEFWLGGRRQALARPAQRVTDG